MLTLEDLSAAKAQLLRLRLIDALRLAEKGDWAQVALLSGQVYRQALEWSSTDDS